MLYSTYVAARGQWATTEGGGAQSTRLFIPHTLLPKF